jgi:hypothetical protein
LGETSLVRSLPFARKLAISDAVKAKLYASNAAFNRSFVAGKPDHLPEADSGA